MTAEAKAELERRVSSTTDVQEACQLGYMAGYEDGCRDMRDKAKALSKRYDIRKHRAGRLHGLIRCGRR